ncbi:MAG: hypothetical protein ABIH38_00115, partial [Patescibacteria group bacterium]
DFVSSRSNGWRRSIIHNNLYVIRQFCFEVIKCFRVRMIIYNGYLIWAVSIFPNGFNGFHCETVWD